MKPMPIPNKRDAKRIQVIMLVIENASLPLPALELAGCVLQAASTGQLQTADLIELYRLAEEKKGRPQ
jgi:hypothetical protein